jgi:hypothetical protein
MAALRPYSPPPSPAQRWLSEAIEREREAIERKERPTDRPADDEPSRRAAQAGPEPLTLGTPPRCVISAGGGSAVQVSRPCQRPPAPPRQKSAPRST